MFAPFNFMARTVAELGGAKATEQMDVPWAEEETGLGGERTSQQRHHQRIIHRCPIPFLIQGWALSTIRPPQPIVDSFTQY
ncbi:MAG: hypothetical protein ACPGVO_17390 [Spirulinaceae cyanobacterium]